MKHWRVPSLLLVAVAGISIFVYTPAKMEIRRVTNVKDHNNAANEHSLEDAAVENPAQMREVPNPKERKSIRSEVKQNIGGQLPAATNLAKQETITQYVARIREISEELDEEDQRQLAKHLFECPENMRPEEWHWFANEVMNKLCHQVIPYSELSDVLVSLANDRNVDIVIRDYAIQHIIDRMVPVSATEAFEENSDKRKLLTDSLLQNASELHLPISGTALQAMQIVLERAKVGSFSAKQAEEFLLNEIEQKIDATALKLAQFSATHHLTRITAIQVCSQRKLVEVLKTSTAFAMDEGAPVSLRLSAIASIGQLGSAKDAKLLEDLIPSSEQRIQKALSPALQKIHQRINSL